MRKVSILWSCIILNILIQLNPIRCVPYSDFDQFQNTLSRQEVERKIKKFLQHDPDIHDFYTVAESELLIFASPEEKQKNNPEFILHFGTGHILKPNVFVPDKSSTHPLQGLRIALDPGHLGGSMASIEERFIDMVIPGEEETRIQFDEGTLATFTAKILKSYLTQLGADVLLTREEPGEAVCELSFPKWIEQVFGIIDDKDLLTEENQKKVFAYLSNAHPSLVAFENLKKRVETISKAYPEDKIRLIKQALFRVCYNSLDLKARSEKINAFNPHLAVIIHYNANAGEISYANYSLTFIPGSFSKGELSDPAARYEFVRLIVTNDLEESLRLSKSIAKDMETTLNIPLMKSSFYQANVASFIDDGVYCRNLALTRRIHSPLCYGETLIQNNPEEAKRLSQKNFSFNDTMISSRIVEVAFAYFRGICDYLGLR